ncbi:phosphotransferase [Nocardia terpenica]|uniref:phosphotransferase n=1 Tax=Nocardia terpenica TaxID=455432 RepID=UPI001893FDBC|nr:phosphotransferase [Nocardia terpenica]MBF6065931.1 phosphotransferase [Nocardia terpenica]MBF6108873.1 phosphotransferase [Nocardia terpenica]MBF6116175.1 phosphotransferase [Nocardia terpenica]MBF6123176.1 phosphotransferase [Nocardia terpenica]MBF6153142.1 phosphotransferase [Nocardia terpenica]
MDSSVGRDADAQRPPADRLPGGAINPVVRQGNRVRRPMGPHADFVHSLLHYFGRSDWRGAPRLLGTSGNDEILTYIEGYAAWEPNRHREIRTDESLAAVAKLTREFHDLTAGHPLAGSEEVVCHNDLSPANTIYTRGASGLAPIAFIDWDLAAPGPRIHDIAHLCWQYLDLGPTHTDLVGTARRIRLICDAYGLPTAARTDLLDTVLWWQHRSRRGIESGAEAGNTALQNLCAAGIPDRIRAAHTWVTDNYPQLQHLITSA